MTTTKTEIYYATRKTAQAHVYITKGVGKVRINNVPVEMIPQETASAAATALSRALIGWTKTKKEPRDHPLTKSVREDLRKRIAEFDKYLISGDARRKEPKKFGGPGARRKKQKSYR